jgi:hypothetical protein
LKTGKEHLQSNGRGVAFGDQPMKGRRIARQIPPEIIRAAFQMIFKLQIISKVQNHLVDDLGVIGHCGTEEDLDGVHGARMQQK